jgi:hypothetical protein
MGRTENVKEPVAAEAENERLQQRAGGKVQAAVTDAVETAKDTAQKATTKVKEGATAVGTAVLEKKNELFGSTVEARKQATEVLEMEKDRANAAQEARESRSQPMTEARDIVQDGDREGAAQRPGGPLLSGRGYIILFATAAAITALLMGSGSFFSGLQTRPTTRAQASAADSLYYAKNRAGQKLGEAADLAKEKGIEAKDYAGQRAGAAADLAKEKAREGADYAKEQAASAGSNVLHRAGKAFDAAKDHAENIGADAYEFAKEAKDFVQEKGVEAKDFIQEKAMEAKDAAADKIHEVGKNAHV